MAQHSRRGSLTEVFHLKCQNNFSDVLKVCFGGFGLWCHFKPTMPFLTHETSEPRVTLHRTVTPSPHAVAQTLATPRQEMDPELHLRQKTAEGISVFTTHVFPARRLRCFFFFAVVSPLCVSLPQSKVQGGCCTGGSAARESFQSMRDHM